MRQYHVLQSLAIAAVTLLGAATLANATTVTTTRPVQGTHLVVPLTTGAIAGHSTISLGAVSVGGLNVLASPGITFTGVSWNNGSTSGGTVSTSVTIGNR